MGDSPRADRSIDELRHGVQIQQVRPFRHHRAFRERLTAQRESVAAEAAKYNEIIEEARAFVTGIGSDMSDAMADKSDKWQEGDRGSATASWIEQLEGIDFVETEIEENDENVTALEELPEEPEY